MVSPCIPKEAEGYGPVMRLTMVLVAALALGGCATWSTCDCRGAQCGSFHDGVSPASVHEAMIRDSS